MFEAGRVTIMGKNTSKSSYFSPFLVAKKRTNLADFGKPPILMVHYRHSSGSKHKSNAHFRAFQTIEIKSRKKNHRKIFIFEKVTNDLLINQHRLITLQTNLLCFLPFFCYYIFYYTTFF